MFAGLPVNVIEFMEWAWADIKPYFDDLFARQIDSLSVGAWLLDWSSLDRRINDTLNHLEVATALDTADPLAQARYESFINDIHPNVMSADQRLKTKLLKSGLEPTGFEIPLRNMRMEAALFREGNLPFISEELKLGSEYDRIIAAQTVVWNGEEVTLPQLEPVYANPDRAVRERAWRLASERQLQDRTATNELWKKLVPLRNQLASNAGLPDYREYRWRQLLRSDYSPQDCKTFHRAIEQVIVPVVRRIYARRQSRLSLDSLKPWDEKVDPFGLPPLQPFTRVEELEIKVSGIFHKLDPQLGKYFDTMRQEGLLDLDNRKGKAPGAFCTEYWTSMRPFICMNAVGMQTDIQILLHESGHGFHVFEMAALPYFHQLQVGNEIAEVASTSMELICAPYLSEKRGGFYSERDAARARLQNLEDYICFWPYMAVVDAFQHWVYENIEQASNPENCDRQWTELWDRYMVGIDWSGLDNYKVSGWQRKLHIHKYPFYYIEYGLAQLGAAQVWGQSLKDQTAAVQNYRKALALGCTASLPELFEVAGAKFIFDEATVSEVVDLLEREIDQLAASIA